MAGSDIREGKRFALTARGSGARLLGSRLSFRVAARYNVQVLGSRERFGGFANLLLALLLPLVNRFVFPGATPPRQGWVAPFLLREARWARSCTWVTSPTRLRTARSSRCSRRTGPSSRRRSLWTATPAAPRGSASSRWAATRRPRPPSPP